MGDMENRNRGSDKQFVWICLQQLLFDTFLDHHHNANLSHKQFLEMSSD